MRNNLFNPEMVVLGGPLSETGEYLSLPVKSAIKKYSLNLASGDTDAGALLESWAGISIVESHNIAEKQPHIKVK